MTHVFVVPGDITRLAADAWLLPTDRTLHVTAGWYAAVPALHDAVAGLGAAADDLRHGRTHALALPHWPATEPHPVLVAVPFDGVREAGQVVAPVTGALRAAAEVARTRTRRAVPLVALPAFGSSGGGGDDLRGELLRTLLEVAATVGAEAGVDVALVLTHRSDLALAQGLRRDDPDTWSELGEDLQERARGLAELAATGQLVPFIGAGVSASAGLPTWNGLLDLLLQQGELPPEEHEAFRKLGALDQAHVLRTLFDQRGLPFTETVAALTDAPRYGLAPVLLAGLPTTEAVTLNYDQLYEMASADARRPARVLPQEAVRRGERWLLKLHGTVTDPASIVLTREDYLGYGRAREALSALAKAMLLTRHLLFVGFGLTDDHFHELMHDVRQVLPRGGSRLGTALLLADDPLTTRLWGDDLDLVGLGGDGVPEQARRLEILLDCVLAHSDRGLPFFLDGRYRHRLTAPETALRRRLLDLEEATPEERATPAWREVEALLRSLGRG